MSIRFVTPPRDLDDDLDLRDVVAGLHRSYMAGVVPGRRGNSNDPATYRSDLVEERWDHILSDPDDLTDVLGEHMPQPLAEALAYVATHWRQSGVPLDVMQRADKAIRGIVWEHCEREAGL